MNVKVKLSYNGSVSVNLLPENDIEKAYVESMLEGAGKGRTVKMEDSKDGGMTVSVALNENR